MPVTSRSTIFRRFFRAKLKIHICEILERQLPGAEGFGYSVVRHLEEATLRTVESDVLALFSNGDQQSLLSAAEQEYRKAAENLDVVFPKEANAVDLAEQYLAQHCAKNLLPELQDASG